MTADIPPQAEVIGDPISHSKSPLIHRFWLDRLGLSGRYDRVHVLPDALAAYCETARTRTGWMGCNVTLPHKESVIPLIDAVDTLAQAVGAVNTIVRSSDGQLCGTNTDVDGVAEALGDLDLSGQVAVVIGAGGAARSAFAHLAGRGCQSVRVIARRPEKAVAAATACGLSVDAVSFTACADATQGAILLINATQLGMTGQTAMPDELIDALNGMASGARVFDMVYAPLETGLLKAARAKGLATADGLQMLVGQAAAAFRHFYGVAAPRAEDAALRRLLLA